MKQQIKRYPLNQCALYRCSSKRKLAKLLLVSPQKLNEIQASLTYHTFLIDKQNASEKREINAPSTELKAIQKRLLKLLQKIERPDWLMSGEKGKSYISNGQAHQFNEYLLTMDIAKFYNNCHRDAVYHFFKDVLQTAPDVALILTNITTFENMIPTGCPTSQLIAYYSYEKMFKRLSDIALQHHCTFTLYVDDLTFSSTSFFNRAKLQREVDQCLRQFGHKTKTSKIKYYPPHTNKFVTGTIINKDHSLGVPNKQRHNAITSFNQLKTISDPTLREKKKSQLQGQIQAAKNIEPSIFPELHRISNLL